MAKTYYQILGISPSASPDEIQSAFRQIARESHPDKLKGLDPEKRKLREEAMYVANEAYGVLSKAKQRAEYDKALKRDGTEGQAARKTNWGQTPYSDFFDNLFGEGNIFTSSPLWSDFSGASKKKPNHIILPENDWGLLVALKKAYEAKEDGKWRVKTSPEDTRTWMPEELYSVKREGDKVWVYRNISDWRDKRNRNKKMQRRDADRSWQADPERSIKPNAFLGEHFLVGEGRYEILGENEIIPYKYREYLYALKSLAYKFAHRLIDKNSKYDVDEEMRRINKFTRSHVKNVRVEGRFEHQKDVDKEWAKKTSLKDFWTRMHQAEGLVVQIEGSSQSKEGDHTISSGESKE